MFRSVLVFSLTVLLFSCDSKQKAITESEKKAKVDSLVGTKLDEINRQAMDDRDRRISIEVKAKADSIVAAYIQANNHTDSAKTQQ